jgi:hypothetical protein
LTAFERIKEVCRPTELTVVQCNHYRTLSLLVPHLRSVESLICTFSQCRIVRGRGSDAAWTQLDLISFTASLASSLLLSSGQQSSRRKHRLQLSADNGESGAYRRVSTALPLGVELHPSLLDDECGTRHRHFLHGDKHFSITPRASFGPSHKPNL